MLAACRRWTRGAVCGWCHGSPAPGSAASLPTVSQCGSVQCWHPGEEREEVCGAVAAAAPAAGKPHAPRETLHPSLRRGLFRLQGGYEKGCGLQLAVRANHHTTARKEGEGSKAGEVHASRGWSGPFRKRVGLKNCQDNRRSVSASDNSRPIKRIAKGQEVCPIGCLEGSVRRPFL